MATVDTDPWLVRFGGSDTALVDRLKEPLTRALRQRHHVYMVGIDALHPGGDVLVSIHGARGCLPLLFRSRDLEAGHVFQVVTDTLGQLDF
jgi:hypothetical protein